MLNFKSSLFITVSLASAVFALEARAITPVQPQLAAQHSQITADQDLAAADGPTTGGGDSPYISTQPAKPGAEAVKPTEPAPTAVEVVPAPAASPTTPASAGNAQETQPVASPVPTTAPAAQPAAPETPVQAASPAPVTPATPEPVLAPDAKPVAPETPVQAATPTPVTPATPEPLLAPDAKPVAPETPVQAATPTPVTPAAPVPAVAPAPQPATPETPVQAATPTPVVPATPAPVIAIQPQQSQPTPVLGAQDQKPKQQLAKKKIKPVHKPDVIVRDEPRVRVHRAPDDSDMVYEEDPVPPMPIGRRHIVVEAENGPDDDVVVVRRVRHCEQRFTPGFFFFHREVRCY